jgi:Ran GTPase-activating protein (RanGAP) involved in mRNA processing and transport
LNFKLSQPLKVRNLNLSENILGDKAAKELSLYFIDNPTIEVLNLSNNGMTSEGLRKVKELIHSNPNLTELIVKGN